MRWLARIANCSGVTKLIVNEIDFIFKLVEISKMIPVAGGVVHGPRVVKPRIKCRLTNRVDKFVFSQSIAFTIGNDGE